MSPPCSSLLKRGRDEEQDLKYLKKEKKAHQSRAEKALVAARNQSAPASPARSEPVKVRPGVFFLPLLLPTLSQEKKKKKHFSKRAENLCCG